MVVIAPERRVKISPKQRRFLQSTRPLVIFRGGIRSGKTFVACIKAMTNALLGRKQIFISNDYPQSRDVVLPTFREVLGLCGLKEGDDYTINLSNMDLIIRGTHIHMRSAERADKLRGISAADGFIDESRNIKTRAIYDILIGRLSQVEDPQVFITSSPSGKDWTWRLAQDNEDCELIIQKTIDNPFLPDGYVERLRRNYTTTFAAQELNADIIEQSGGVFYEHWFRKTRLFKPNSGIRFWDVAVSIRTAADYSVGALCCLDRPGRGDLCIVDVIRGHFEYPTLRKKIIIAAIGDGKGIQVGVEEAGAQRGFIDDIKRLPDLRQHILRAHKPRGDKWNRALVWAARAELGQVYICEGPWNDDFIDEVTAFTADISHEHDDQVDAVSGAYEVLAKPNRIHSAKIIF